MPPKKTEDDDRTGSAEGTSAKGGRPRLSESERDGREKWKELFRSLLDQARLTSQQVAQELKRELVDKGADPRTIDLATSASINHWRSSVGDLRVPPPDVANALVRTLRKMAVWDQRRADQSTEERSLVALLGYPSADDPVAQRRDELVQKWLGRDLAVQLLTIPIERIGSLQVVVNAHARNSWLQFLLRSRRFLSVTIREGRSDSPVDAVTHAHLPGLIRGDLQALLFGLYDTEDSAALLQAVADNLRFAILEPPPPDWYVYRFCQPYLRVCIGANWTRPPLQADWFSSPYSLTDFMFLKQIDRIQYLQAGDEREEIGLGSEEETVAAHRWLTSLLATGPIAFYKLHPNISSKEVLNECLLRQDEPILLRCTRG